MTDATDPLDGMQRAFDRLKAHAVHLAARVERLEGDCDRLRALASGSLWQTADRLIEARAENTRLRAAADEVAKLRAEVERLTAERADLYGELYGAADAHEMWKDASAALDAAKAENTRLRAVLTALFANTPTSRIACFNCNTVLFDHQGRVRGLIAENARRGCDCVPLRDALKAFAASDKPSEAATAIEDGLAAYNAERDARNEVEAKYRALAAENTRLGDVMARADERLAEALDANEHEASGVNVCPVAKGAGLDKCKCWRRYVWAARDAIAGASDKPSSRSGEGA